MEEAGIVSDLYLDTQVVAWLYDNKQSKISAIATRALSQAKRRLVSPMVLLELEYLRELGHIAVSPSERLQSVADTIVTFLELEICRLPFTQVAAAALGESWTRDPFDRLIVANAIANHAAPLVTADRTIRKHYANAVW